MTDRTSKQGAPAIDWSSPIGEAAVFALFDDAAKAYADRPCIDFLGKKYSYGEVADLVARTAKGFQQLGLRKGGRVGLCLPNTPYYVICYYAALKAGGVVVNYSPLCAEREMAQQIEDSDTRLMVTMDLKLVYPKVAAMLGRSRLERIVVCPMQAILPAVKSVLFTLLKRSEVAAVPHDSRHMDFARLIANDGAFKPVEINPSRDVAVLQYTGGTTGLPKGAMLSHANLSVNVEQLRRWFPQVDMGGERMLAVLPFFHVFAMTVALNLGVRFAAELILVPRFDLAQLLKIIHKRRPTLFPGVPTVYTAINGAADLARYDLSSIKVCISGGAPLPVEVKARFEELTGCELVEGYGLTETAPVAACNPIGGLNKAGSIGLPLPVTEIEIRSPAAPFQRMAQGEKGEVCIRGPQVMMGYLNRPDETRQVMTDGFLRSGDIGYCDADGYIFLVDRIKDLILSSGFNVYPRVIEEALYEHPAVAEAVAIGIPDPYRGQAPKAFVRLRDGAQASPEELKAFLADKLSRIEMPKAVEIRDSLPKTLVGKLSKKELLAEEQARQAPGPPASAAS